MIMMNDFKVTPPERQKSLLGAVQRVLESGRYVLGNEVISFEKQWASICGVDHAIGVGNGMDALEISLRLLGVSAGDEVVTTPNTAFATILAIIRVGAIPVLADVELETGLISVESALRCISKKTKAEEESIENTNRTFFCSELIE